MKNLFFRLLISGFLIAVCGSNASAQAIKTPSGRAEMVFVSTAPNEVLGSIQLQCLNNGWGIQSRNTISVVCEVPTTFWESTFARLAFGNAYTTPPKTFAKFTVVQDGDETRTQAVIWSETQTAFGQVRQNEFNDDSSVGNMMRFLGTAGGQFPIATTFGTGTFLGVFGFEQSQRVGSRMTLGHRVTGVAENSLASRLGLQPSDYIYEINNQVLDRRHRFVDVLFLQLVGQPLNLGILRGEERLTLSAIAETRPPIKFLVPKTEKVEGESFLETQLRLSLTKADTFAQAVIYNANKATRTAVPTSAEPGQLTAIDMARAEAEAALARLRTLEAEAAKQAQQPSSPK